MILSLIMDRGCRLPVRVTVIMAKDFHGPVAELFLIFNDQSRINFKIFLRTIRQIGGRDYFPDNKIRPADQ